MFVISLISLLVYNILNNGVRIPDWNFRFYKYGIFNAIVWEKCAQEVPCDNFLDIKFHLVATLHN